MTEAPSSPDAGHSIPITSSDGDAPAMRADVDATGLEILDPAECLRLLGSVSIGRLVFTRDALPAVRLATFFVERDSLVLATAEDDRYRAAERGDVVAFEADEVDQANRLGWRVTVVGRLSPIDPETAAPLIPLLPRRAWTPVGAHQLVRLTIESYDGRRLATWPDTP